MTIDRVELHGLVDALPDEQVADAAAELARRLRPGPEAVSTAQAAGHEAMNDDLKESLRQGDTLLTEDFDDEAVERWLHEVVAPVCDATIADPSRNVSMESVRQRLAAEHDAYR